MADIRLCEPSELYNLLNQRSSVSRLAEVNYLCLVDARQPKDYRTSHIITAKNIRTDSDGRFLLPEAVEVDSMQRVVVYDLSTSSLLDPGRASGCARALAEVSLHPVHILRGGFLSFSALYPFLRTEKILYTMMELEKLRTYPVEVTELLYLGDQAQGADAGVLRDLKIGAIVSLSGSEAAGSRSINGSKAVLEVSVEDSVESDLFSSFERICSFIDSHIDAGSPVLIVSRQGRSRCSAAAIAFIMHRHRHPLERAWTHVQRCKPSMRPNAAFLTQLSDWELHTVGNRVTDTSQLLF